MLLVVCATFDKVESNTTISAINLNKESFNGEYEIEIDNTDKSKIYLILDMLDRDNAHRHSIDKTNKYWLKIQILDNDLLQLTLIEKNPIRIESESKLTKEIKIKAFEDNYIYLDNENIKRHNIPFILGGYDMLKCRLTIDVNQNLIIDSISGGMGAFLFFIWSGEQTMENSYTFKHRNSP